ncbi:MAG: hypothetical protein AABX65_03800 [Nanoarchaeota archaeon]
MAEQDRIYIEKVKYSGTFDFKELYRFCYDWLVDNGYLVSEKSYGEKVGSSGKDVEIEWEAKKKISDYFRFVITAKWRILGMTSVDVEKDGKKIGVNKGAFEITLRGLLEKDYEHRWENNAFTKFLRGVYDRYVIRARIDQYEGKIFFEVDELVAQIKSFLALEGKKY